MYHLRVSHHKNISPREKSDWEDEWLSDKVWEREGKVNHVITSTDLDLDTSIESGMSCKLCSLFLNNYDTRVLAYVPKI
jgi:hypothetical protein